MQLSRLLQSCYMSTPINSCESLLLSHIVCSLQENLGMKSEVFSVWTVFMSKWMWKHLHTHHTERAKSPYTVYSMVREILWGNPTFHSTFIGWNLNFAWKISTFDVSQLIEHISCPVEYSTYWLTSPVVLYCGRLHHCDREIKTWRLQSIRCGVTA